jgi:hypothetical protein
MVSQRNALLAWTGHTLSVSPRVSTGLSLAHWGNTHLTGRGLAALSAPGQIYQLALSEGEEFVAHPGSVVAYTVSRNPPLPFRLKSTSIRLQIPSITSWLPDTGFLRALRDSNAFKFLARLFFSARTTVRRSIWGDRLFLQFRGPTTILMSSRGVRIAEVLSAENVNEIADSPAGVAPKAVDLAINPKPEVKPAQSSEQPPSAIHIASVEKDGKVVFEDTKSLKEFVR